MQRWKRLSIRQSERAISKSCVRGRWGSLGAERGSLDARDGLAVGEIFPSPSPPEPRSPTYSCRPRMRGVRNGNNEGAPRGARRARRRARGEAHPDVCFDARRRVSAVWMPDRGLSGSPARARSGSVSTHATASPSAKSSPPFRARDRALAPINSPPASGGYETAEKTVRRRGLDGLDAGARGEAYPDV